MAGTQRHDCGHFRSSHRGAAGESLDWHQQGGSRHCGGLADSRRGTGSTNVGCRTPSRQASGQTSSMAQGPTDPSGPLRPVGDATSAIGVGLLAKADVAISRQHCAVESQVRVRHLQEGSSTMTCNVTQPRHRPLGRLLHSWPSVDHPWKPPFGTTPTPAPRRSESCPLHYLWPSGPARQRGPDPAASPAR